jgi:hypothetical protein
MAIFIAAPGGAFHPTFPRAYPAQVKYIPIRSIKTPPLKVD